LLADCTAATFREFATKFFDTIRPDFIEERESSHEPQGYYFKAKLGDIVVKLRESEGEGHDDVPYCAVIAVPPTVEFDLDRFVTDVLKAAGMSVARMKYLPDVILGHQRWGIIRITLPWPQATRR
jgi:hypothetical protein